MAPKSTNNHDVNTFGEYEPSTLSRGYLIQWVADLQWQLSGPRTLVDRERELAAIHRDTAEREQEAVTQINRQLLMQIKALRKAQEQFIELSAKGSPNGRTLLSSSTSLSSDRLTF